MSEARQTLHILFLASEASPFVKVGGLGDVAGSLPIALQRLYRKTNTGIEEPSEEGQVELDIRLVLPYHSIIQNRWPQFRQVAVYDIPTTHGPMKAEVYDGEVNSLPVYLIGGPPFTASEAVYSNDNYTDGVKYIFFSLAALQLSNALGWKPDIIHANDWHTAIAVYALYLKRLSDPALERTASLLSIHNLPYMGSGTGQALNEFGLPAAANSSLPWWAQDMPLPLGLLSADAITTVSPTYAEEILTPEYGSGLDEFLKSRRDRLTGILNGMDLDAWNPMTDSHLEARYGSENLAARDLNKQAIQKRLGLAEDVSIPLLAMVTRLDPQKGVDLALQALRQVSTQPWQAVFLGVGTAELEQAVHQMEANFPDRFRAVTRFDAPLSHLIYGGADALLIPSRYEPCGLTQMIGMHYGCIPVVRATGGLKDTVFDYSSGKGSTGFVFQEATPEAAAQTLLRVFESYPNRSSWRALQRQGMQQDYSWERSARQYVDIYRKLVLG